MTISELVQWNRPFRMPIRRRGGTERSLGMFQDEMNRLFTQFFEAPDFDARPFPAYAYPSIDIVESEREYKVRAELPGINPEDIEVSMTDGFITIKGETEEESEETGDNYLRRETGYGAFQRTIALPPGADYDKADASFRNGILTVEMPKKAEAIQAPKKLTVRKAA